MIVYVIHTFCALFCVSVHHNRQQLHSLTMDSAFSPFAEIESFDIKRPDASWSPMKKVSDQDIDLFLNEIDENEKKHDEQKEKEKKKNEMKLHSDCTMKIYPPNTDLSSRFKEMLPSDLKDEMWCLDEETGLPGIVSGLRFSKGIGGQAKYNYTLRFPHSGTETSVVRSSGDHICCPIMENIEYMVSHMDGDQDLICLNQDYEEMNFKLSKKERADVYKSVTECIKTGQDNGKQVYVKILEGPG